MSIHPLNEAQINLSQLINKAATSHEPVVITGKDHNAVLLSEEAWSSIQEPLYLLSVPGMRESIKEGLATPVSNCDEVIDW